jgi:hypothetical protein
LFAARVPESGDDPRVAIDQVINAALPKRRIANVDRRLLWLTNYRRIRRVHDSDDVGGDGILQPLGTCYADGFDILVNKATPSTRRRFTLAHEVCHTFFYELVPEMKFVPHREDACEELLCNRGAAAILMPAWQIEQACRVRWAGERHRRHNARRLEVVRSLSRLFALARDFQVSAAAMANRLRELLLSSCRLQVWVRGSSGEFLFPGSSTTAGLWAGVVPLLEEACKTKVTITGRTYLESTDAAGVNRVMPIAYHVAARGNRVYFLWSRGVMDDGDASSLFRSL